jgi:pimeloyl-ACP methyl ester carboxylesterase
MRQLITARSKQIADTDLRGIPVPVALLWGRRDQLIPLRIAEAASSRFGWPLLVVDDTGHVSHLQQPDGFLRALGGALSNR